MMFIPSSKLDSDRQIVLLAPADAKVPSTFNKIRYDADRHHSLLADMQRMRGSVYVADGAIESMALRPDGRHWTSADRDSWHLLSVDSAGHVCGCARYLTHSDSPEIEQMNVGKSALASSPVWAGYLARAVEREVAIARSRRLNFAEVGGWALTEELRRSTEGLRIALATYALGQKLGGCISLTTATVRHGSASILRKLGGSSMFADGVEIPRYFDPQYNCEMEILRFDSSNPNAKYATWIDRIASQLSAVPVITSAPAPWATKTERLPGLQPWPACA